MILDTAEDSERAARTRSAAFERGAAGSVRVGIVTPSFQQADYLEACLQSVLSQGYENLAYVVMDGGSDDGSRDIIERYADRLAFWTSARDDGQSDAIDRGIRRLDADVVGWLNSDDLLLPGAISAVAGYFERNAECQWVCGDGVFAYEPALERRWVKVPSVRSTRDLLGYGAGNWLPQPSVFFRKSLYEEVGGVRRDLHYTMDLELWLRMSKRAPLHYLPGPLSILRQHDDAKTLRYNEAAMQEAEQVIRAHARGQASWVVVSSLLEMRRRRAESACASGMKAYFDGRRRDAMGALNRAVGLYPPIACSRAGARLWLRLGLPGRLRAAVLQRP